jgi:hypothetical protein
MVHVSLGKSHIREQVEKLTKYISRAKWDLFTNRRFLTASNAVLLNLPSPLIRMKREPRKKYQGFLVVQDWCAGDRS